MSQALGVAGTSMATPRDQLADRYTDRTEPKLLAPVSWYEHLASPRLQEAPYDEASPERRGRVERAGPAFLHFCITCGAWGSFGYGVTRDQPGLWYCGRHRPNGDQHPALGRNR